MPKNGKGRWATLISRPGEAPPRPWWLRYGVAVGSVVAGWAVREALTPVFGRTALPFIFLYLSIVVAAWYGGLWPAVLATLLSALAADWFFFDHVDTLWPIPANELVALLTFVSVCLIIISAINAMHRANARTLRDLQFNAAILNCSLDCIISMDQQGKVIEFNPAAEKTFGYTRAQAIGRPLAELIIPPHLRERHYRGLAHYLATGEGPVLGKRIEMPALRADGVEIPVELSINVIQPGADKIFTATVRDITQRKKSENDLAQARDQLARANADLEKTVLERTAKLQEMIAELEHVSYAIVHDLRAPLRAMQAHAHILATELDDKSLEQRQDHLRRIMIAASRLDKLIQDALNYNRAVLREMPMQPVDLSRLVRDLVETYPNFDPTKADIRIEGNLPVVLGNEALLTECFSNLLGNAVKFVSPGTRPQIAVRAEATHGFARIWVEDNGIGIPKNAQPRLFGMFERLIDGYEGTGIGLAIVRKVVERMSGKVGVESEPGEGSRFWVELRVAPL